LQICKAGPFLFHLSDPQLQVEAMQDGVHSVQTALLMKHSGNAALKENTQLSGRLELLEIVAGSRLWDQNRGGKLSKRAVNGATIISFSNSGTSATWYQLHLPAQTLDFFAAIQEHGLKSVFLQLVKKSGDLSIDSLCDSVESRKSLAPIWATVVKTRKKDILFTINEKQVLKIYEYEALNKGERFDTIEQIAERIKNMEPRYSESFVKQLANIRDKKRFFELLTKFAQSEKTSLRLTKNELRVLSDAPAFEAINLLYLLCIAQDT
jgi:hypothetical protein